MAQTKTTKNKAEKSVEQEKKAETKAAEAQAQQKVDIFKEQAPAAEINAAENATDVKPAHVNYSDKDYQVFSQTLNTALAQMGIDTTAYMDICTRIIASAFQADPRPGVDEVLSRLVGEIEQHKSDGEARTALIEKVSHALINHIAESTSNIVPDIRQVYFKHSGKRWRGGLCFTSTPTTVDFNQLQEEAKEAILGDAMLRVKATTN